LLEEHEYSSDIEAGGATAIAAAQQFKTVLLTFINEGILGMQSAVESA
jgi:hypothetical protein